MQMVRMVTDVNFYQVSQNKSISAIYRAEYVALREFFLNAGRVAGFGLIILVSGSDQEEILKYLIFGFSLLIVIMGYMSISLNKRLLEKSL